MTFVFTPVPFLFYPYAIFLCIEVIFRNLCVRKSFILLYEDHFFLAFNREFFTLLDFMDYTFHAIRPDQLSVHHS